MTEAAKKLIEKISSDEKLKEKFKNVSSKEDVIEIANNNGINISEVDFVINDGNEISENELKKVSGGLRAGHEPIATEPMTIIPYFLCGSVGINEAQGLYSYKGPTKAK